MSSKDNGTILNLDLGTVRILDALAQRWGVTREAAMKRALAQASPETEAVEIDQKILALNQLQKRLQLSPEKAAAWQANVRDARR